MTSINSHVLQCQVLYEQIPTNETDPHLLIINCIIVLHVNSAGDQPCHSSFWVRNRATKPFFNWSVGITAKRTNGASQGVITTQDYWHHFWGNWGKWHMLNSFENAWVVSRRRYFRFCSTDLVPMSIFLISNGIICHVIITFFVLSVLSLLVFRGFQCHLQVSINVFFIRLNLVHRYALFNCNYVF